MRAPHSSASLTLRYLGTDPEKRAPRPPKWFSLQALSPLRPGWRRVAPAKLLPKQLFFGGAGTRLPASLRCEVSTQPPESRLPAPRGGTQSNAAFVICMPAPNRSSQSPTASKPHTSFRALRTNHTRLSVTPILTFHPRFPAPFCSGLWVTVVTLLFDRPVLH